VLKAESEAAAAPPAAAPPAADEGGAPPNVALSLACFGCARLPSEMDDGREKHPVCPKCRKLKVPTTYWCCVDCPANPGAWQLHAVYHKEVKGQRKINEDGGARQQRDREAAERQARIAAQSGDAYSKLLAEGARYVSKQDYRKAGKAFREAIVLKPDEYMAYYNLGVVLDNTAHHVEAAQRFLEAKEREPVGSEDWAAATAKAFDMLRQEECSEVAKPEWWNDEELKALSARVLRAGPNEAPALAMRALMLFGLRGDSWEVGSRSAAELKEAATLYDRLVVLCDAPAGKAAYASYAIQCRTLAAAMPLWL